MIAVFITFSVQSTFWIVWGAWQRKFKHLFWDTSFATSELYAGSLMFGNSLCGFHSLSERVLWYVGYTKTSAQIPSLVLRNHNFPVSHPTAAVEPSGLRHMQRGRSSSSFLRRSASENSQTAMVKLLGFRGQSLKHSKFDGPVSIQQLLGRIAEQL